MKKYQKWLSLVFIVSVLTLASCGGGDDGCDPTDPTCPLGSTVAGNWFFSGQVSSNNCTFLQGASGFQLGTSAVESFSVSQSGSALTASPTGSGDIFPGDGRFTGTVSDPLLRQFTLVQTNPIVDAAGNCTYSIGGGAEVTRTTDNPGNGSVNLTVVQVGGNCGFLGPLPCSVVYTGTWSRTTSAKLEGAKSGNALTATHSIKTLLQNRE